MSLWNWASLLSPLSAEHRVTLGEGATPVVRSVRIGPAAGIENLHFKLESINPTGSYKDRFAAAAISHMQAAGKSRCLATSSGNTGAALAAYCAAANLPCQIAIVEPAPAGKCVQMLAYGAQLYRVKGFGVDADVTTRTLALLASRGGQADSMLQVSAFCYSPLGMEGVQTISYELAEQAEAWQHVFVPAGGGGLTLAVARGFQRLVADGRLPRGPQIHCVQPQGNATIAGPLQRGESKSQQVDCTTRISGLQVPIVLDGDEVIAACRASGGRGYVVADEEVFAAQRSLAREEGVFCEPAGATALAGALQAISRGEVRPADSVVCLVTGSGFKDLASIEAMNPPEGCPTVTDAELDRLLYRVGRTSSRGQLDSRSSPPGSIQ